MEEGLCYLFSSKEKRKLEEKKDMKKKFEHERG